MLCSGVGVISEKVTVIQERFRSSGRVLFRNVFPPTSVSVALYVVMTHFSCFLPFLGRATLQQCHDLLKSIASFLRGQI